MRRPYDVRIVNRVAVGILNGWFEKEDVVLVNLPYLFNDFIVE